MTRLTYAKTHGTAILPFAKFDDVRGASAAAPQYWPLPWRVVPGDDGCAAILDRAGHTLFLTRTAAIAQQVVSAVNQRIDLISSSALYARALRDVEAELRPASRTTAVSASLRIIDEAFEAGEPAAKGAER